MADAELAINPALTSFPATVAAAVVPAVAAGPSLESLATSPRRRSRRQYNEAMKWVRRLHLYAGLLLTPWVFLYGVTAFLFNHPGAFPDQEIRQIDVKDTAATPLADFPRAADLAARVVAALNVRSGAAYTLVRPDETSYTSDLIAQARGQGQQHAVRINLESGRGTIRSSAISAAPAAKPGEERAPFAVREPLEMADAPASRIKDGVPAVLAGFGLGADEVTLRTPPQLAFYLKGDGEKTWRATYNLQTGAVAGRPAVSADAGESGPGMSTRRLLTRLHMTHGYSDGVDAKWAWALAVDAMAFAMIGWAISGLLMWWQMKNVRSLGTVMIAISAVLATGVTVGMTAHLRATAVGRGEAGTGGREGETGGREGRREGGFGGRGAGDEGFRGPREEGASLGGSRRGEDGPGATEGRGRGRSRDASPERAVERGSSDAP